MSREVYLIGCHVENEEQSNLLRRLVSHLNFFKKDYVLVSHTMLPSDIVEKSVGFIYDTSNPVFRRWDLENAPLFNFFAPSFKISSKYILYGASPYYHVGVLRLLLNGIKYVQTLDYDVVHWIEYDMFPDFDRANENVNLIAQGNQFVFHGLGSFFSFDSKVIIQPEFLNSNDDVLFSLLKENDYVAEIVIMNKVFQPSAFKVFDVLKSSGDYSQNFDQVPVHWSLFSTINNELHIFLLNRQKREIKVDYSYNSFNSTRILIPQMYHRSQLGFLKLDGTSSFKISVNDKLYFEIEASSQSVYDKLIKDTKVW
jgi:hypothetical protein